MDDPALTAALGTARRTYKIHLGSGNILMQPNDQYLCIVMDAAPASPRGRPHLPMSRISLPKYLLL